MTMTIKTSRKFVTPTTDAQKTDHVLFCARNWYQISCSHFFQRLSWALGVNETATRQGNLITKIMACIGYTGSSAYSVKDCTRTYKVVSM